MRDRVKQWLGLPGNDCFKHSAYGHMQARSRRWCLHAVWDVIRSLFVFMPSPRISLFANMLAWISITQTMCLCVSVVFFFAHMLLFMHLQMCLCVILTIQKWEALCGQGGHLSWHHHKYLNEMAALGQISVLKKTVLTASTNTIRLTKQNISQSPQQSLQIISEQFDFSPWKHCQEHSYRQPTFLETNIQSILHMKATMWIVCV